MKIEVVVQRKYGFTSHLGIGHLSELVFNSWRSSSLDRLHFYFDRQCPTLRDVIHHTAFVSRETVSEVRLLPVCTPLSGFYW